uniref:Uncharacterized protein n=3 Tax=Oryza sativa subsp. japonica TaxID=39947 RepID=Q84MY9_ORYSJ|nr:hypothetical protein Os03g40430 [Oryza sativa Japonica Group]ABF97491.1 hypothetical protein LOC_Os03g40430 [Oryza sativa Japonica Group]
MSHMFMLNLNGEVEWETYVDIVLGLQFKSLEVFAWKKERRESTKEFLDLNESPHIESPMYCHELKNDVFVVNRKEELIEKDVEVGDEIHKDVFVVDWKEELIEGDVQVGDEKQVEEDVDIGEERHRDVEDGEVEQEMSDDGMDVNQSDNENTVELDERRLILFIRDLLDEEIYTREECEENMIFNGLNSNLLYADLDNEVDESASDSF